MAKCVQCGQAGLTLKVDFSGLCETCHYLNKETVNDRIDKLQKFHDEYMQIPNARAEAERILSEAKASVDALMEEAYATKEHLEKEIHNMRVAAERDIRLAQVLAEERLVSLNDCTSTTVASVESLLAGLLASASKDFANLSELTVSKAFYADQKKRNSSEYSDEPFTQLAPAAFKRAAKKGYVVFDLETTGLKPTSDRIIEIGAIKYDGDGHEIDRYSTLVNPECHISNEAYEINNITDDMVADAPLDFDVLPAFFEFVGDYPIIAHNAGFDISFLHNAVKRYRFTVRVQYADSLPMARKKYTNLSRHRLGIVAKYLGIPESTAHRSIGDCEMLGAIVADLLKP